MAYSKSVITLLSISISIYAMHHATVKECWAIHAYHQCRVVPSDDESDDPYVTILGLQKLSCSALVVITDRVSKLLWLNKDNGIYKAYSLSVPNINDKDSTYHYSNITATMSVDGCLLAGNYSGKLARLLSLDNGYIIEENREGESPYVSTSHTGSICNMLTCNNYLIACSADSTISVQPIAPYTKKIYTPVYSKAVRLKEHTAAVLALANLGDGRFVSSSADNTVKIWSWWNSSHTCDQACRKHAIANNFSRFCARAIHCVQTLDKHTDRIEALAAIPSTGTIISGSKDRTVRIWHKRKELPLVPTTRKYTVAAPLIRYACTKKLDHDTAIMTLAVLPDNKSFAAGCYDGSIVIWCLDGTRRATIPVHHGPVRTIVPLNQNYIASAGNDSMVYIVKRKT